MAATHTDSREFRTVMGRLPTAVSVIASETADGPVAMVVGTLTSVSLEPPLVAVLPARSSRTWRAIGETGRFVASVMASDQRDVIARLAGRAVSKYRSIDWDTTSRGGLVAAGALAWVDVDIEAVHDAGDHFIVIGAVQELVLKRPDALPLIFFRHEFHRTMPVHDLAAHGWE